MFIEVVLEDLAPAKLMFLRLLVAAVLLLVFTAVGLIYGAALLGEPVNSLGLAPILSGVALGSGLVRRARPRGIVEQARP